VPRFHFTPHGDFRIRTEVANPSTLSTDPRSFETARALGIACIIACIQDGYKGAQRDPLITLKP
jgi:hypothetical protein